VDAGIKHLAVLCTGEMVPNPAPFKAALKKLGKAATAARRGSARLTAEARRLATALTTPATGTEA
jgi:putative transposase